MRAADARTDVEVLLVGAGPGDPSLLTLAGAAALGRADVVVYDYLANPALLAHAPAGAERVYVGKKGFSEHVTQDQINRLLVRKARELGSGAAGCSCASREATRSCSAAAARRRSRSARPASAARSFPA